jgi:hypothetical protein
MTEESKMLDASASGHEAKLEQTPLSLQTEIEEVEAPAGWSRLRALGDRLERFEKSAPGRFWGNLSTADFMNSSFAFAALAVLSVFP